MTLNRSADACRATLAAVALLGFMPACATHEERERSYHRYETHAGQPAHIGDRAADSALHLVGVRYRYGGSSPSSGFDCSGLVQFSYRQAGASVPRTTDALREASIPVRSSSLRRGDLVFFHQEGKRNGHVGIYLGSGEFIHAPSSGGRVRKDSLQSPYWRKHFSQARRIAA